MLSLPTELPSWWVLVAFFVGYGFNLALEFVRDRLQRRQGREERRDSSRIARADRRDEFQRETLIELQDVADKLVRNAAQSHMADEQEYRQHGTWGRCQLPDGLGGDEARLLSVNLDRLRTRVLDEDIRNRVQRLQNSCSRVSIGALSGEADSMAKFRSDKAFSEAIDAFPGLNEAIGRRLRKLDDPSS